MSWRVVNGKWIEGEVRSWGSGEKKNKREREMKREKKERKGCRLYAGARDIWVHVG